VGEGGVRRTSDGRLARVGRDERARGERGRTFSSLAATRPSSAASNFFIASFTEVGIAPVREGS